MRTYNMKQKNQGEDAGAKQSAQQWKKFSKKFPRSDQLYGQNGK